MCLCVYLDVCVCVSRCVCVYLDVCVCVCVYLDVCVCVSYSTSTFSAIRFDENPSTYQREKEDKKAEGSQISHFYWSFLSDMAVKGLRSTETPICMVQKLDCYIPVCLPRREC